MYLQIPTKLEQYVDEIRRRTTSIDERNKFTLLKLGVTQSPNSKKIVYLLYNPFPTELLVDCNFFTKSSKIFKLYPTQFLIAPNSACAFVAYTSEGEDIEINKSKIINEYKDKFMQYFNSKFDYSEKEIFEAKNNIKIEITDVDFSNTVYLDVESKETLTEDNLVDYIPRYESLIGISLEKLQLQDGKIKLDFNFVNTSDSLDIKVKNYRVKIYDLENRLYVNVGSSFIIKSNSSKISSVYINKIEFDQINRENLQIKVTLQ